MTDEYYELYQQCKLERDQLKQQLEEIRKDAVELFSEIYDTTEESHTWDMANRFLKKYKGKK